MIEIWNDYFLTVDTELFFWLRVFVVLPIAITVCFLEWLRRVSMESREKAGRAMVRAALRLLPRRSLLAEYVTALLGEQRRYERYRGWCDLSRASSLSFEEWRHETARAEWLQRKMRVSE